MFNFIKSCIANETAEATCILRASVFYEKDHFTAVNCTSKLHISISSHKSKSSTSDL